jgi:PTH1 family peptidyl-tRNA hydrolase
VLNKPPQNELKIIEQAVEEAAISIDILLKDGVNKAMNRLNGFKV